MSILSTVIIVLLCVVGIIYHEYGHMHAAKVFHVKVNKFCIGFGKKLWQHTGKDGVNYQIALLPLGGSCEIDPQQQDNLSLFQYLCVVLAGVARNAIFCVVLLVAGQIIMARGFVEPIILVNNLKICLQDLLSNCFNIIRSVFDVNYMIETGGTIGQYTNVGEQVAAMSTHITTQVGMSVMIAGYLNMSLVFFNLLPIPGIDGGQAVLRIISDFWEKVLHKKLDRDRIVNITNICITCVLVYSAFLLMIGLPGVRDVLQNLL